MSVPVVEVDTAVAATPQEVWQAMTAPETAMFPGTEVETDWQVGSPIVFRGEWEGKTFLDRGEILSATEGREISFTHWSDNDDTGKRPDGWNVVAYTLAPEGGLTRVTLRQYQEGDSQPLDAATREKFKQNFQMMLDGLKQQVEAA